MTNEEILKKNGGRRYDIILSNPPYDKSLHLKFLEKYIQIADKVISIQPVRWIEEKVGKYKKTSAFNKYKDSIADHIKELDIYTAKEMEDNFGAAFNYNIGIYLCDENGGFDYDKLNTNDIVDKVIDKMPSSIDDHLEYSTPKNAIVVSLITGGNQGRNNVIDLFYHTCPYKKVIYDENGKRLDNGLTFEQNRKLTAWGNVKVKAEQTNIKFDTVDECINFFNYTRTYLFRYLFNQTTSDVNVAAKYLPFMGDYTHEWTDKMLYDYFDIDKDMQEMIESYIDKTFADIKSQESEKQQNKRKKKNV